MARVKQTARMEPRKFKSKTTHYAGGEIVQHITYEAADGTTRMNVRTLSKTDKTLWAVWESLCKTAGAAPINPLSVGKMAANPALWTDARAKLAQGGYGAMLVDAGFPKETQKLVREHVDMLTEYFGLAHARVRRNRLAREARARRKAEREKAAATGLDDGA